MARRKLFQLTDISVKQAKHLSSNKSTVYPDGDGLRLLVYASGIKVWQFTYSNGKSTTLQIGRYPAISLANARVEAAAVREKLRQGVNPVVEKRVERARSKISAAATFQFVGDEFLKVKINNVSAKYYDKVRRSISSNLYPRLGKLPIKEIDSPLLREALLPIEARGSLDMLAFMRRIAGEIFDYAKALKYFSGDNPATALTKNIFQRHKRKHFAALSWKDIPGFLHRLDGMKGTYPTIATIRLLVLTGCRPGEVRGAKWGEFDLDKALWKIPAERMKKRTMHIVPLARQTVDLLKKLQEITGHSNYLFPAQRGSKAKVISDITLLKAIRRHVGDGIDVTAHGFRAVFRTYAEESELWSESVMECAIAHGKKTLTEAAYARATHLQTRTKLAQWYSDELDKAKNGRASP